MVIGMSEFLTNVGKLKTNKEKVDALKANDSIQLRMTLQAIYDPAVKFSLPEGDPPYTPNALVDQENVYLREIPKLRYFFAEFYPNLKQTRREQMFIELLERCAPADALLLLKMKSKKPLKGITVEIVNEALPGLIPSEKKE